MWIEDTSEEQNERARNRPLYWLLRKAPSQSDVERKMCSVNVKQLYTCMGGGENEFLTLRCSIPDNDHDEF